MKNFDALKKTVTLSLLLLAEIITVKSQTITTIAGTGAFAYGGDNGLATSAQLWAGNSQLSCDASGNLYITDYNNSSVRKINISTGIITTIAGTGVSGFSGDGAAATSAQITFPSGVASDNSGNIYISDGNRIRKINNAGIINTICGNGAASSTGDGGLATAATVNSPYHIVVDGAGNIYFTENAGARVRKISAAGIISTICGNGTNTNTGDGGLATAATIQNPRAIAIDASGNLYVSGGSYVRKIIPGGNITAFAGTNGGFGYSGDGGQATLAQFSLVYGIAVNNLGEVVINDPQNFRVRKVDLSGILTTCVGTGVSGFSGDGGLPTAAQTSTSSGMAVSGCNLYLADFGGARIRRAVAGITPVLSVNSGSICLGNSFSISPTGVNTFTIAGGNTLVSPTITSSYTVIGTSSVGCVSNMVTSNVTVNPNPTVTVASSATSSICQGETATLTASGANTYSWNAGSTNTNIAISPSVTTSYTVTGNSLNGCSAFAVITQVVNTCTGIKNIENFEKSNYRLYPNPASESINIISESIVNGNTMIEIANAIGQIVMRTLFTNEQVKIDISNLNEGIYVIKLIENSNVILTKKLIKN